MKPNSQKRCSTLLPIARMHISSTVDTFCKPDRKTQLGKKLHDISAQNISYLQSLLFVDIVELQNTYHRNNNARGTTTRAEYKRMFV